MIMKLQFLDYDDSMFLLITKYFLLRFLQFFLSDGFFFIFIFLCANQFPTNCDMYKMKVTEICNLICAREFGKVQLPLSFKLGFNF